MSEYEKVYFEKWQDLAKAVIDCSEIYFKVLDYGYYKISFNGNGFNCDVGRVFRTWGTYIKKQPTLEELIAIKPRLCWVWDGEDKEREVALIKSTNIDGRRRYVCISFMSWDNAQMLTDDEIKQFLNGE